MKMSLEGRLYPIILKKVLYEQLITYYSIQEIKQLNKKIRQEYRAIINRFPNIGGNDNFFIKNVYLGGYIVAVYKNVKDSLSLAEFEQFVLNSLDMVTFLKKKMQKQDFLSYEYRQKLEKASKWCQDYEAMYPDSWQINVLEAQENNKLSFQFNKCGLVNLCQNEGVPEVNPILCQTDFVTYGYAGVKLERDETLAQGDKRCLFVVTRK